MIVVAPAQAEAVLAALLHPGGVIAAFPVAALFLEKRWQVKSGPTDSRDLSKMARAALNPLAAVEQRRGRARQRSCAWRIFLRVAGRRGAGTKPRQALRSQASRRAPFSSLTTTRRKRA